ncbi:flagellar hook-associated protein FlgK [Effusibacillus consociatus]|uniref:Flagellar hook-associated protein 1 n=1 Tax=Effusibacillus consociatus TaxID=1117041 RepID=A0ABV9Q2G9_9BACL
MRSTFHGLEVAKRGLYAQQTALNTTSHNVANANTPGYSRQVVDMVHFPPLQYPAMSRGTEPGQLGQGVDVDQIKRIRDQFLDAQFRNENRSLGEWEIKRQTLDKIEAAINEPSENGLANVINRFFNSWHDLSASPESITARKVVKQTAIEMVEAVQHISKQLSDLDSDLKDSIGIKVNEVNSTLNQVKDLNHQIKVIESLGDNANDLRDRRDQLVDALSKIVDVKVTEASGQYTLTVGGQTVIQGDAAPVLLTFDSGTGAVTPGITGGEIKGLIESRTTYVKTYQGQLDALVNGLVQGEVQSKLPNDYVFDASTATMPFDAVLPDGTTLAKGAPVPANKTLPKGTLITLDGLNGIHEFGYTAHNPAKNAPPFFVTTDGSSTFTAANIKLNDLIVNDEQYISTSNVLDANGKALKGNGDIALMIGELVNRDVDFSGSGFTAVVSNGTIEDYFQSMIGEFGVQSRQAKRMETNQGAMVDQIDNQRKSVTDVSIDEEMANMIKFQQAYNASARIVTMIDSILDRVINGMGLTR